MGATVGLGRATSTATSTQNFTVSGLGDPTGALIWGNAASGDASDTAHWQASMGFTDFTTDYTVANRSEDAQGSSDTGRVTRNDSLFFMLNAASGATLATASFNQTVPDGIQVSWDTQSAGLDLNYILFGGDSVCETGTFTNSATQNGDTTISGLSGKPDLVFIISGQAGFGTAAEGNNQAFSFGQVARNPAGSDGIQQNYNASYERNSATMKFGGAASVTRCGVNISIAGNGNVTINSTIELTSWNSDGFVITTRDGTASNEWAYLAVRFPSGEQAWTGEVDAPTSAQVQSVEGPAFTPQFTSIFSLRMTTSNALDTQMPNDEASAWNFGAATSSSNFFCTFVSGDDGPTTSDTRQFKNTGLVYGSSAGGTVTIEGDLDSFDSLGPNIDWTNVPGASIRTFLVVIEEEQVVLSPGAYLKRMEHQPAPNTLLRR